MKNGKFGRKAKKKFIGRFAVVLVSVTLICVAAVGATIAFLSDVTTEVENIFTPSQVTSKVVEDPFNGITKSNVKIQNTGDISAYIRADIVVTWMDKNGNILGEVPQLGTDYTWTLNTGAAGSGKWFEKGDYFYWPKEVAAYDDETAKTDKDLTDELITTATALKTKTVGDTTYYVSIEILSSAIQSVPERAVEEAWKVTVTDGVITG